MTRIIASAIALFFSFVFPAAAVEAHHEATSKAGPSSAPLSDGEVRRVDKEAKKLTIRHGPIQNLDMPPMTMVFQVQDLSLLENVKPGDRIRFSADKIGGAYTVTKIEPAR